MYIQRIFTVLTVCVLAALTRPAMAQEFQIARSTIDGGGALFTTGGEFELSGTIGQHDAGEALQGGEFEITGGFWAGMAMPAAPVNIESASSCAIHDEDGPNQTEWCIDFADSNGIEPRNGGPRTLRFEMSGEMNAATVSEANVQVECSNQTPATIFVALENTSTVVVEFGPDAFAAADCCRIGFEGMASSAGGSVAGTSSLVTLGGDTDFSGGVTGGDALRLKPKFGRFVGDTYVTPEFDINLDGVVTGDDFSQVKPHFENVAPPCP